MRSWERCDEVVTERLRLRPISRERARTIATASGPRDDWADGYPTEGDIVVAGLILAGGTEPDPPWCAYELVERAHGLTVGGAGFKAPPYLGRVEIGYGLAAAARGRGLATEAVQALLALASSDLRVVEVEADTAPGNLPSQRVLLRAGFTPAGTSGGMSLFRWQAPPGA